MAVRQSVAALQRYQTAQHNDAHLQQQPQPQFLFSRCEFLAQFAGASLFVARCLDFNLPRRAFFTAIRAENAAIAGLRPQQGAARRAAIELDSDIGRHRFGLSKATGGTLNDRDEIHLICLPRF
jgi:hypothetical protein